MRSSRHPVVRVSRGGFAAENYGEVKRLIDESAAPLIPAIDSLSGLLYYHAGVDPATNTVANVSVWESEQAARQMDTLPAMLAQRPILETAGVTFDRIANYPPAWTIERDQAAVLSGSELLDILFKSASERWAKLGFTTRLIRSNGVDLHVAGGGAGRPLLLLHGYPQSGEIWRLIAPELARAYRLIIPDLRGMGLSGIAEVGYDLPTVAEDIHQLLRTLDVTTADVVGHDWGGAVAAVYALRYRDEVRSLTFIESAVAGAGFETIWSFTQPNPAMTFIPFLLSEPLAEKLITAREETFLHHLWATFTANKERATFDTWQPYVAAMKRPGLIRSSSSYYRSVYAGIPAVRDLLGQGKLTLPVLSIAGQASFGDVQRRFVDGFAANVAGQAVIDDAGHFVAEEQPEALMKEMHPFLAG